MAITDTPPVATTLGPTTANLVTRAKPIPLTRVKTTDAGNPLYTDVKGNETTKSETVVSDPKSGEIIRRYQHEPVVENVTDDDGNQMFDYVETVRITQPLVDDEGKPADTRRGTEADLSAGLQAEWAALIVKTRLELADTLGLNPWLS